MHASTPIQKFHFAAEALEACGGFAPAVALSPQRIQINADTPDDPPQYITRMLPADVSKCYVVQHPRESSEDYGLRVMMSEYVNHLLEAVTRYTAHLGSKPRMMQVSGQLQEFADDCDMRGTKLVDFLLTLAHHTKARGSELVVLDMPPEGSPRKLPIIRMIHPETLVSWVIDGVTGKFTHVETRGSEIEYVSGAAIETQYTWRWDKSNWYKSNSESNTEGQHGFEECPVIAITENGGQFPVVGAFYTIAGMSRDIWDLSTQAASILSHATFPMLAINLPPGNPPPKDAALVAGVSSVLTYQEKPPAIIEPTGSSVDTIQKVIEDKRKEISRIGHDISSQNSGGVESAESRRLRFMALNSDLTNFSRQLASLEGKILDMVASKIGVKNTAVIEWPDDFNLSDTQAELNILSMMKAAGMPAIAQAMQMRRVVHAAGDSDSEDAVAAMAAIDRMIQSEANKNG